MISSMTEVMNTYLKESCLDAFYTIRHDRLNSLLKLFEGDKLVHTMGTLTSEAMVNIQLIRMEYENFMVSYFDELMKTMKGMSRKLAECGLAAFKKGEWELGLLITQNVSTGPKTLLNIYKYNKEG